MDKEMTEGLGRKMKTVCIVGANPRTRDLVDWDSDKDIWTFNEAMSNGWAKRITAMFDLHRPQVYRNSQLNPQYLDWLRQEHPFVVYMQKKMREFPSSQKYPLREVKSLSTHTYRGKDPINTYLTSSVAMALALAVLQDYGRIELYGVEMSVTDTEYMYQRDGVFWWLGIADARGIEVVVPVESNLFNAQIYGYDENIVIEPREFRARAKILGIPIREAYAVAESIAAGIKIKGVIGYTESATEYSQARQTLGETIGEWQEALMYSKRKDPLTRQEFESRLIVLEDYEFLARRQMDEKRGQLQMIIEHIADSSNWVNYYAQEVNEYNRRVEDWGRVRGQMELNKKCVMQADSLIQTLRGFRREANV